MDSRKDPFRGFNFRVQIEGITVASFREASGLDASTDAVDYREGCDKTNTVRKLSGLNKYSNITLKRGITDEAGLWEWRKQVIEGKIKDCRKSGSIVLLDAMGGEPVAEWEFILAWPSKWTGPTFNAAASEVAIETLELTHEGVERKK